MTVILARARWVINLLLLVVRAKFWEIVFLFTLNIVSSRSRHIVAVILNFGFWKFDSWRQKFYKFLFWLVAWWANMCVRNLGKYPLWRLWKPYTWRLFFDSIHIGVIWGRIRLWYQFLAHVSQQPSLIRWQFLKKVISSNRHFIFFII